MSKQKTQFHPTMNESDIPVATRRGDNGITLSDPTEVGDAAAVIPNRDDRETTEHDLMTMREAADFLMEDEGIVEDLLAAAAVPLIYEDGQAYVAPHDLHSFRDRDTATRRQHLRELTRRSIEAGLDDVDYSRLADQP